MIISLLYLAFNALLTCLMIAKEWNTYGKERKTLRVSHPVGIQRSTYFISLPWRYGGPLMAANSVLHWLVSQSIFLVSIVVYIPPPAPPHTVDRERSVYATGYSTQAALISQYSHLVPRCRGRPMLMV